MISWRCVANIKLLFFACSCWIPATKILVADMLSVPEHNSSPRTKLYSLVRRKIVRNSYISTANDDKFLNMLSLPKILVKIYWYGLNWNDEQGTYKPACAITTAIPRDLIRLVFPTAFVPYNKTPSTILLPKSMSFVIYNSFCCKCSIKQCLKSFAFTYDLSELTISGLQ